MELIRYRGVGRRVETNSLPRLSWKSSLPSIVLHLTLTLVALAALPVVAAASDNKRIRLVILGDSTVCDYPATAPTRGWGLYIAEGFSVPVEVHNLAVSGRSTKTFIKEGRLKKALTLKADFALIQFGHNDSHAKGRPESTDAATDYKDYLRSYVDAFAKTGTVPILVTPMHRRTFRSSKLTEELKPYADAMTSVARERKCALVDLYARSGELFEKLGDKESAAYSSSPKDRTHFSEKGARAMARLVLDEMKKANTRLAAAIK
jgi:lysophospholipase L1-like esterase